MEEMFFFELKTLPDFTLTRYQAIGMSDLSSVVKNNVVFLRQLHSLGLVLEMSFHLYYSYIPSLPLGTRIKIFLMCRARGNNAPSRITLSKIISSLAVSSCYSLEPYESDLDNATPLLEFTSEYQCFNSISKKEYLTNPNYAKEPPQNGLQYYSISEWSAKQNARMYNSLKLLGNYDSPTVIRVDIFPVSDSNEVLDKISKKGIYSKIQDQASFKAFGEDGVGMAKRDEAASKVNSFYDDYFQTMSASLQFQAVINVFGDSEINCRLLGDVICSEVLDKGLIEQKCELGTFKADYKIEAPSKKSDSIFDEDYSEYKVPEMANLFTIDEVAPFFSFPYLYPSENIGIRKETDPKLTTEGLKVGLDVNGYEVRLPLSFFAKHAYISGVPGSGKTFSMKHLVHSLSKVDIPFLVFEPAKREYRGLYDVCAEDKKTAYGDFLPCDETQDIILLCPKTNSLFPLHINPFEIPLGVSVNDYISTLYDVFNGAFSWPQPTPMILRKAIIRAYKSRGFFGSEVITDKRQKQGNFPVMTDLYTAFQWIMDNDSSYKGEIQGNIKGVLETRIGSLMEGNVGEIFNLGISTIRPENWNKRKIILELENLSNEHANFITLLIISLIRLDLKKNPTLDDLPVDDPRRKNDLRHVIFFEEAHNLIGKKTEASDSENASSKIASASFIKDMLAEVRAYKQGIVIADQLPTAIATEVLKNTSIKIAHKQTASDEREAIGSVMSADSIQLEMLTKFEKGQGLITFEGVQKPFYFQVEAPFDYKSETMDDIMLAKKLATTSNWYSTILYNKSLGVRFKATAENASAFCENSDDLIQKNKDIADLVRRSLELGSVNELFSAIEPIELAKIAQRAKLYMEYSDKPLESMYGIRQVVLNLVEAKIGQLDRNEKLLSSTAVFIDEINRLVRSLSELYNCVSEVLKLSHS